MKRDASHSGQSSRGSREQNGGDGDGGRRWIVDWAEVVAGSEGGGLVLAKRMSIQTDAPSGRCGREPLRRPESEGRPMAASVSRRRQ